MGKQINLKDELINFFFWLDNDEHEVNVENQVELVDEYLDVRGLA